MRPLLTALLGLCLGVSQVLGQLDHTVDLHDKFQLQWSVRGQSITLLMKAKATGWVGFGLAEMGGMRGADMVYYEHATKKLTDSHAFSNSRPNVDTCQDWQLESTELAGGQLSVTVTRKLVTGDAQDRVFLNDAALPLLSTPVIAAWGDSAEIMYHGAEDRVQGRVRFFASSEVTTRATSSGIDAIRANSSVRKAVVTVKDYEIPAKQTIYERTCFNVSDLIEEELTDDLVHHAVAFEPYVHEGSELHVHHFVVHAKHEQCDGMLYSDEDMNAVFVWAPGTGSIVLPEDAGFRLLNGGFKSLVLEIHYDNPTKKAGVIDHSGFIMYHTPVLRKFDAGIFQIGDPAVWMHGRQGLFKHVVPTLKGTGWSSVTFDSGDCTDYFVDEEVTVWARFLHMHKLGQKMVVDQFRDDKKLRTDSVEFYDFDQAGGFNPPSVGAGFSIKKGDKFTSRCFYFVPGTSEGTATFGPGSEDEMCIDFLYYYPAQPVPYSNMCVVGAIGSLVKHEALEGPEPLGRTFGGQCTSGAARASVRALGTALVALVAAALLQQLT